LGAQGNLWSEYLYTAKNVEYSAFPRLIAMSEVTWSPVEGRKFEEFRERLAQHLKRLDQLKVNYRKLDPAEKK
jgi:hexosaminidase